MFLVIKIFIYIKLILFWLVMLNHCKKKKKKPNSSLLEEFLISITFFLSTKYEPFKRSTYQVD